MYDIFRKNLGLIIAPASENNTSQDGYVHQERRACADIEKGLTLCEKVGVNDELVKVEITEGREKCGDGRDGKERKQ